MGVVTWIDLGSDGGTGWSPSPSSRSTPWTGRWSRTPWLSSSSAHVWGSRRGLSLRQDIVLLSRALKRVAWELLMESQRELQRPGALGKAKKLCFGNSSPNQGSLHILLVDNCMHLIPILNQDENIISPQVQCRGNRWQRRLEGGEVICSKCQFVPGSPLTSIQGRKTYALLFLKRLCLIRNQNLGGSPDQKPPCW